MSQNDKIRHSHVLKRLTKYFKGHIGLYLLALLMMGVAVAIEEAIPWSLGKSLEFLGKEEVNLKAFFILNGVFALLVILKCFAQYFQTYFLNKNGNKVAFELRNEVLTHIQTLSHNQFHSIPNGKLVTRATSDIGAVYEFFTNILVGLLRCAFTIVFVFILMFNINRKLAFVILAVCPVIAVFSFIFSKISRRVHRTVRDNVSSMNTFLSENISGMKVTQVFNQEDKKYKEFCKNNDTLKKSLLKEISIFGVFRPTIYILYVITVILVLWFGGNDAINVAGTTITFAVLYTFTQYVSNIFGPIQELADQINELQSSLASAEKIFSILDMESEIKELPSPKDVPVSGSIEFRDVWFAYVPGEWVLKGVSFKIEPKDTVAFVGATGAGKSTILSLIVRNYDIQKGQILIDGVDIKDISIATLRSHVGQMLQDVFLFSGTIEENISMNEEGITEEMVKEASDYVNASKFINELPDGFKTEVKERGENFSLGQRQLISFARTIITKPNIMILDEATSNIDTETEILIQDSLNKILKMGTVIVVAHRLSTIQHCKKIFVFENGNIIESGSHQELLAKHGKYYHLYKLQYSKEQDK